MFTLVAFCFLAPIVHGVNNGLARTPQMGWNNWNSLGCDVAQDSILNIAKILKDVGLRDVGYNYVVLDDCWQDGRGKDGRIIVDKKKFPKGMEYMSSQIHDMGFLYGMYSSAGEMTCARFEGSLDHEEADAQAWADWGVDYLKYDNCYHMGRFGTPKVTYDRYNVMAKALNATGRPILYGLCNWGEDYVFTWGMSIANSFRISGDIYDDFNRPDTLCACDNAADPHCVAPGSHCSVMYILNHVAPYSDRGQPGGWNDLDALEVGVGGQSDSEYVAHFSMWAALKSPLIIGADLRTLTAKSLSILNNPAVIAVNQDPLGKPAWRVNHNLNVKKDKYGQGETQVWTGPLYPHDQLVVLLNAADEDLNMSTSLEEIFVHEGPGGSAAETKQDWDVYDLWTNRMSDDQAQSILSSTNLVKQDWYNATELPYKVGLEKGDGRLLGELTGRTLNQQYPELKDMVSRHSVKMYRLRPKAGSTVQAKLYKTEL